MRRTSFALATTAVVLPLVLTASAVPASATTNTLTVSAIGRDGHRTTAYAYVEGISNNSWYALTSGHSLSLPKGQYAVVADVQGLGSPMGTDTLVAKVVTVSGHTSVTLDARPGVPVRVSVDGSTGAADPNTRVNARICVNGLEQIEAFNVPGKLFLVPNASTKLNYAYLADIFKGPQRYVVAGVSRTGLPARPGGSVRSSALARLAVQVRANEYPSDQITTSLQANDQATPGHICQAFMGTQLKSGKAPYWVKTSVSPGIWRVNRQVSEPGTAVGQGGDTADLKFLAGRSYTEHLDRAVFGPWMRYPELWRRSVLFTPGSMIENPDPESGPGNLGSKRESVVLSKAGKVIKQLGPTAGRSFAAKISSAGWYRLVADARRYGNVPAGLLSRRVVLDMHFYANPAKSEVLPVFYTRFIPVGLNSWNHAASRSTTPLSLTTTQLLSGAYSTPHVRRIKQLKLWASSDNGRTWHAVAVTRKGNSWSANVRNPASGTVSLRSQVWDYSGDYTTETVYAAYGIG